MRCVLRCGLVTLALCATVECVAQRAPDWNRDTLSGDWGGARTRISERGATGDFLYTGDALVNASGGARSTGSLKTVSKAWPRSPVTA